MNATPMSFDTPLSLCGPLRQPKQMLADQEYGGHTSIHDNSTAETLGLRAGPIEGPTHFSLFVPLLAHFWGKDWFERGCLSVHFRNMVVEGETVRAFVELPPQGAMHTRAWAEKGDGTPVLEASASVGPDHGETLLEQRMARLRPPGSLVILSDLEVGMTGAEDEPVRMDPDQNMGKLYPFSLNEKLEEDHRELTLVFGAAPPRHGDADHPAGDGQRPGRIHQPQGELSGETAQPSACSPTWKSA